METLTIVAPEHMEKLFINGQWQAPTSSKKLKIISPVTEQVVFEVAEAVEQDVDKAVNAARKAFDGTSWPRLKPTERAQYVRQLAGLLRERAEELETVYTAQVGVLASFAKLAVPACIAQLDLAVNNAETFEFVQQHQSLAADSAFLTYEPLGVAACICPWNVPLFTLLSKVGAALVAGCTVIVKPAPQTPLEAIILAECAEQVGFPKGVINVLPAEREASDYLIHNEQVDKVSFTGSLSAGKHIASVCGQRMARVTLELGGKSPAIILGDYDLGAAAASLAQSICRLSGQNCGALSRVLVSRDRHDEFVDLLKTELEALKVGLPSEPDSQIGPLTMQRQLEQVEHYVALGISEGADLVYGGKRADNLPTGYYYQPTLFANVDNGMTIAQEEIFGPVISVIPYDGEEHAINIANQNRFGLVGAIFTNDSQRAYEISRQINTGTMSQNGSAVDFSIAFGGFKQSGIGREGGVEGLKSYMEIKTILLEGQVELSQ